MTRFIPREKLGRKARRELDNRQRRTWPVSPAGKIFASGKVYNRKQKSHDFQSELESWDFSFMDFGLLKVSAQRTFI